MVHLLQRNLLTRDSILGGGIILAFVLMFTWLVVCHASLTSATFDETAHLGAGYSYLKWDDYRLNPEHPPLIKKWAALFILPWKPWPSDLTATQRELAPHPVTSSLMAIKRAWAAGLEKDVSEWQFGFYFLYGTKSETLQRFRASDPLMLPPTASLDKQDFLNNADDLLFWGRMAILVLGLLLAALVFSWARELWGLSGGVIAVALFCSDPNFIAHSGLITTDVGETVFLFGAVYFLWRSCRCLTILNVTLMLLFFGLAFVSKFTSILLPPMFALALLGRVFSNSEWPVFPGQSKLVTLQAKGLMAAGLFLASIAAAYAMIWALYDFRYSAAKDPAQAAVTESWVMTPSQRTQWREPGYFAIEYIVRRTAAIEFILKKNQDFPSEREVAGVLDSAPIGLSGSLILYAQRTKLLPEAYLYGFAYARMRSLVRGSFLRGEYSTHGFWSYFPWSFTLKTPLVSIALIFAGVFFAIRRRESWHSIMAFLLIPVIVYLGVSISSRLNIGLRHLLPIYPFLFVLAGGLAMEWSKLDGRLKWYIASLSLTAIAVSGAVVFAPPWNPALVYPYYLSYFNELAGGPANGYESLVDSNLDWGQDLKGLKSWLEEHPLEKPIYLSYFGMADPRYYGIRHVNTPKVLGGFVMEPSPYEQLESKGLFEEAIAQFGLDLREGDYIAISATNRNGVYDEFPGVRDFWIKTLKRSVLVDQIGQSIYIYKVGPQGS